MIPVFRDNSGGIASLGMVLREAFHHLTMSRINLKVLLS